MSEEKTEVTEPLATLWDHLHELRQRILLSLCAVAGGFAIANFFSKEFFRILRIPYDRAYQNVFGTAPVLINTGIFEAFMVYLKVALLASLFFASPVVFYQAWRFISPALRPKERGHVIPLVFWSTLFFVGGALFGYFLVFPPAFEFFLGLIQGEQIAATIRMESYFELASWMLLGFGVAFEAPLAVLYLVYLEVLRTRHLLKFWRGVIVGIFVLSAVITPTPDIATMCLMAVPLLILYGVTILASMFWR